MRTIAENIKFPDFKKRFKGSEISAHLVRINNNYFYHSKRIVVEYSYEELPDFLKSKVEEFNKKMEDFNKEMEEAERNIRAHRALVAWATSNSFTMTRSQRSESEYHSIRHADGNIYKIRISGHRHPTGSMTNLALNNIDSTDYYCCAKYCDMLGIDY